MNIEAGRVACSIVSNICKAKKGISLLREVLASSPSPVQVPLVSGLCRVLLRSCGGDAEGSGGAKACGVLHDLLRDATTRPLLVGDAKVREEVVSALVAAMSAVQFASKTRALACRAVVYFVSSGGGSNGEASSGCSWLCSPQLGLVACLAALVKWEGGQERTVSDAGSFSRFFCSFFLLQSVFPCVLLLDTNARVVVHTIFTISSLFYKLQKQRIWL